MIDSEKSFYTINEFACELGLHPNTVRMYIRSGLISALKLGTEKRVVYRIPNSEFERLAKCNMRDILKKMVKEQDND